MRINVFLWKLRVLYWLPVKHYFADLSLKLQDRLLYLNYKIHAFLTRDPDRELEHYCNYIARSTLAYNLYIETCTCYEELDPDPCGFCEDYCEELDEEEDEWEEDWEDEFEEIEEGDWE